MKIWFDADNAPHVLIMRKLATTLSEMGHQVIFTARDRASTCELLDLSEREYIRVGGEFPKGKIGKALGTVRRAVSLAGKMKSWNPHLSFGHGSRSLPIASRLLGIPTITMFDYEWVNTTLFNLLCKRILIPEVIDEQRCKEAGIQESKVKRYKGLKEEIYIADTYQNIEGQETLALRDDCIHILLRPPASNAHYHNAEAQILLEELIRYLKPKSNVQVVYLPRYSFQESYVDLESKAEFIIPSRAFDGPGLVASMDLLISGGGTMSREAAVLGIPSFSIFRGKLCKVDETLERNGNLVLLRNSDDVRAKVKISKKSKIPDPKANEALVGQIVQEILDIGGDL